MEESSVRKNILVEQVHVCRNVGIEGAQVVARIFWSSRYVEMEVSGMRKNILVE